MKNFYKFQFLVILLTSTISFSQSFTNGVFVTNEGGFGASNATLSFISNANVLQNNIFATANSGAALGDTAQSMFFEGSKAYIIMNVSGTIKVVNRTTMVLETTITGFVNPRYMASFDGKLYVTCWGDPAVTTDDQIKVIDIATNTIIGNFSVPEGPENIVLNNGLLYIAQKGGYGFGSTVSILNPSTSTFSTPITVGDVPTSLEINDGFLYILSSGKPDYSGSETFGSLVKYDLSTNAITNTISFATTHPKNLKIVGSDLYYTINKSVHKSSISDISLPNTSLFNTTPQGAYGIYAFNVIDDVLFVADAGDYTTAGKVYTYSTTGSLLNSFTVGVTPSGFYKADTNLANATFTNDLAISLYPNPTSDKFYLNINDEASISVIDMSGRIVLNQKYSQNGIEISTLKPSVYLVSIESNGKKTVKYLTVK